MTEKERKANLDAQIQKLLNNPDQLIKKKPFTRGVLNPIEREYNTNVRVGETVTAILPHDEYKVVSQDTFKRELDPYCHKVLFDDNIPSITAKLNDGQYVELEFKRMPVPFQKRILEKHVLYLCGYDIQHTLCNEEPTDIQKADFAYFKRMWKERNQGGMRTKMVTAQKSYGDAGLLYYFDYKGRIKSRLISFADGYVICPHNDDNGDRIAESVYYRCDNTEIIDTYTDEYQYRHERDLSSKENSEWTLTLAQKHGFPEIPLVTKRGPVAWNDVQEVIEVYEIIYNIFLVIQKRHGWGILYIKGNFIDKAKKIAGAVVLTDNSIDKSGDAKYLEAPTPAGMLETLKLMEETIQKGSGTTFILPKDISTGGDTSGVAIQITQSLDNEEALGGVIEWQNVASKMTRLFKFGLATEMVESGKDPYAITRFSSLDIHAAFKQWRPRSDYEYNQMLATLYTQGILSNETAVEKNTESNPDELQRLARQAKASAVLDNNA